MQLSQIRHSPLTLYHDIRRRPTIFLPHNMMIARRLPYQFGRSTMGAFPASASAPAWMIPAKAIGDPTDTAVAGQSVVDSAGWPSRR